MTAAKKSAGSDWAKAARRRETAPEAAPKTIKKASTETSTDGPNVRKAGTFRVTNRAHDVIAEAKDLLKADRGEVSKDSVVQEAILNYWLPKIRKMKQEQGIE